MIKAQLIKEIVSTNESKAFNLYKKSCFGKPIGEKIRYTLSEAFFLMEKKKIEIYSKNKKLTKKEIESKFQKIDKKFLIKYPVFKDLREKGYIIKTALKFGADFRVYDKGKKPGKVHAKWIVFTEHETKKLSWQEFSAKNRVAHSTKKKLLLAILDEESDVSYYEVGWLKP
jgi:tRNA-intron endonuclease